MNRPVIGQIVHFMPLNIMHGAGPLPAMILRVLSFESGACNLLVFMDGAGKNFSMIKEPSVSYSGSGEPGTWHWISSDGEE